MILTERACLQGVHVTTAYHWCREGKLPVPARKVGRLTLVSPEVPAAGERAGLYARVWSHDQKPGPDRRVARLTAWAAQAELAVEAKVGSGMNGTRPRGRRLLPGPAASVIVVEHRDRLGQMNTGLTEAALRVAGRRLVVLDTGEVTDDLVRDMIGALRAVGCAQRGIGPAAVTEGGPRG